MFEGGAEVSGFCSFRYIQATILFFCSTISFSQSMSLAIAIVAMVNNTSQHNQSSVSHESHQEDTGVPVFDWNPETQGIILSSFAYGSLFTLIPSGYLAGVLGTRKVLGIGLVVTSLLTILTPLAASQGMIWIILTRVTQGIFQGLINVSFPSFWTKWAPPKERAQLFGILFCGYLVSNVLSFFLGGLISHSLSWLYIFYIFGILGFVCFAFFYFLVYDNPMTHPYISDSEKEYIISSWPEEATSVGWSLPIKAMARSRVLWAIFVTTFCLSCAVTSMSLMLPTLISNIFDSDIRNNGFLSSLPSVAAAIILIIGNIVADLLTSKNVFRLVVIRKIFISLGMLPGAVLFIAVPYVSNYTAVSFIIFSFGMQSLGVSGLQVNIIDVAARYSGFVSGIVNFFGTLPSVIIPNLTGYLINQDPINGWKNIFFMSSGIVFSGMTFFLIFGHAEIQSWAKERTTLITRF
ncbi:probable small intestine urate exporter isoform X2 [Trichosurus vulpecula]|uniref:probable small intestine urate exporter isoform X2 n=1 Tax=Trichosurus vulpecula TaxID=9337 RepID=UPI00186AD9F7|nr:probable small intestine urate exporter isoform X2 [Trichosurus vulpecula]